jgi:hypothetical protein
VVAEANGKVVGSNFLDERLAIDGVGAMLELCGSGGWVVPSL